MVSKFNKDESAKTLCSKAYEIISSDSKSGNTAEKKVVSHSVTLWTRVYYVVKRLLEVKESVLITNNMNTRQPEEWATLLIILVFVFDKYLIAVI